MSKKVLTFKDKARLRDEAIVDFSQGFINRRDFMFRMTGLGIGAAAAMRTADALAKPREVARPKRWAKQADATVTMIKGPHHPDDAKFWEEMKTTFEAANPGIELNPTFFDWAQMDAQLTAGYASDAPADVVYLVDLVLAKFGNAGAVADIAAWINDPAWAAEKSAIAPFTFDVTKFGDKQLGIGVLGAAFGIFYNKDLLDAAGITEVPKTREELTAAAMALQTDEVWGFQFRDRFPDYGHWDLLPYVHNDGGDVLSADLSAQGFDPAAASAIQYLADMKLVHKVSPEAGAYDWASQKALFEAGRIAILHDEYPQANVWELGDTKVPFTLGVAQAPATAADGAQTTMGNFGYASISEKSPAKEAAWEFIKWWASADVINPYAAKIGLQGVRTDSTPPYESTLLQQVQAEFVPAVQGVQIHENYYQMLTNLWPEIEKAYRGEIDGATAAANAAAAITELI